MYLLKHQLPDETKFQYNNICEVLGPFDKLSHLPTAVLRGIEHGMNVFVVFQLKFNK